MYRRRTVGTGDEGRRELPRLTKDIARLEDSGVQGAEQEAGHEDGREGGQPAGRHRHHCVHHRANCDGGPTTVPEAVTSSRSGLGSRLSTDLQ